MRASNWILPICLASCAACSRATAASFVPQLDVTLSALALEQATLQARERRDFDLRIVAWLRFTPNLAAQDIPSRGEVTSENLLLSCDPDDLGCIEEAAETEGEVERLLGELE